MPCISLLESFTRSYCIYLAMNSASDIYKTYFLAISAMRTFCANNGLVEFLPAKTVPGFSHHKEMHMALTVHDESLIFPFQQSIFNRLSSHYLGISTYCIGPCYRLDSSDAWHLSNFYQFTFELHTSNMEDLCVFTEQLLNYVLNQCGKNTSTFEICDLRKVQMQDIHRVYGALSQNAVPTLVKYKPVGVPPLLNMRHSDYLEHGIEVILPGIGESVDGGVRDPAILNHMYGITPELSTSGASVGLERLIAYILGVTDLREVTLT